MTIAREAIGGIDIAEAARATAAAPALTISPPTTTPRPADR